jgi:ABC-type transport system involved in multi-copper enzyme maturation permease subunit
MRDLARSTALVFTATLPRLLRARRTLLVAVIAFAPAGFAMLLAKLSAKPSPALLAVAGGWLFLVQVVVPLASLILASAAVAEEVEDRTLTYLFTRPMPRAALLLGRWLGIVLILSLVFALATWAFLSAAAAARGEGPDIDSGITWPLFAAVLAGVWAYTALAAALGAFVKHPIVVGLCYTFAVEGFLANLPGRNQLLTVQFHLRSLIAAHGSPLWGEAEGFASTGFESGRTAGIVLAGIVLGALLVGSWRISRREFVLSA